MLKPSLGERFVTEWTSSLPVIRASHLVQPDNGEAKTIRGTSGRGSQMAFDFSDPGAASLKTSKDISAWGCPTSSKTWQDWVTEQRGAYSARLKSVRRTSGSGSSSWPTVTANEDSYRLGGESQQSKCLSAMARRGEMNWPTASVSMTAGYSERENCESSKKAGHVGNELLRQVIKHGPPVPASSSTGGSPQGLWETATVSTGAHRQKDGSMIDKLDQQVKNWATPIMGDSHLASTPEVAQKRIEEGKVTLSRQMAAQAVEWATPQTHDATTATNKTTGHNCLARDLTTLGKPHSAKLNPRWVETLMGLPVGWVMPSCASPVTIAPTSCDSWGTESSQQPQP